jgi:hypothetical protein
MARSRWTWPCRARCAAAYEWRCAHAWVPEGHATTDGSRADLVPISCRSRAEVPEGHATTDGYRDVSCRFWRELRRSRKHIDREGPRLEYGGWGRYFPGYF